MRCIGTQQYLQSGRFNQTTSTHQQGTRHQAPLATRPPHCFRNCSSPLCARYTSFRYLGALRPVEEYEYTLINNVEVVSIVAQSKFFRHLFLVRSITARLLVISVLHGYASAVIVLHGLLGTAVKSHGICSGRFRGNRSARFSCTVIRNRGIFTVTPPR